MTIFFVQTSAGLHICSRSEIITIPILLPHIPNSKMHASITSINTRVVFIICMLCSGDHKMRNMFQFKERSGKKDRSEVARVEGKERTFKSLSSSRK